jgi:hypothetical protein
MYCAKCTLYIVHFAPLTSFVSVLCLSQNKIYIVHFAPSTQLQLRLSPFSVCRRNDMYSTLYILQFQFGFNSVCLRSLSVAVFVYIAAARTHVLLIGP